MTAESKTTVRRCWEECFNRGNFSVLDEMVATTYVWHGPDQEVSGRDGIKQLITMIRTGLPDVHMTFEDQFAERDKVASRWTMHGTQRGELFGIPPTGKPATFTGIIITRMADGRIAEEWENFDQLGLLQQLGAIPTSEQGGQNPR